MPKRSRNSHDSQDEEASSSRTAFQAHYREPKYLRMVKPMIFDISYSDCSTGRFPSHAILPRHLQGGGDLGSEEETVVAPKSDEAHRRYWKLVIGTYMMHYGRLHPNLDEYSLYRLRKFPVGYELYARPRVSGSTRHPDQYMIGFDSGGERKIMFDSPYAFVLHGISLVFGSTNNCPCKVCDDDMRQKDIRKVLRDAAPYIKIPSIVQWKKRLGHTSERASPSAAGPVETHPSTSVAEVKDEPVEVVKLEEVNEHL